MIDLEILLFLCQQRIVFKEYDGYAKKIISFTKILLKNNE